MFEDEHLVILNKPAGILSIPDRYNAKRPNLARMLSEAYPEDAIHTVHRLDRETSGAICFAKSAEAHRALSQLFEKREVKKIYQALVIGRIPLEEGSIEEPIAPSEQKGRMIIAPWGKPSVTFFKVLERFKEHTLVAINLATGRTHQIRVHFAATGHPLAVDQFYGPNEGFFLSDIKGKKYRRSKDEEERPLMSRVSLHAQKLEFQHPFKDEVILVEAPFPKDFRAVVQQLRKWAKL